MARPKIGLALGSGSARGWSHIGVIEGLAEAGIEPDIVCGCSIGSLVGAAYVTGRLAELKSFAEGLNWRQIASLLDVQLSAGGLVGGEEVVALLRRLEIKSDIKDTRKPYAAVATDLETGREIWLREGRIEDAVRASISLPGIFSPARLDSRWLVDGGLVNPVPVSICRALGADVTIAVNLNGDLVGRLGKRGPSGALSQEFLKRALDNVPAMLRAQASAILPKLMPDEKTSLGYFDVLMTSINVMQDQITRARLAGEPPHVMLVPRLGHLSLMEFNRASEAIAEGRAAVEQALPLIRRYI